MKQLEKKLQQFVGEREWDAYHNPKNLVLALCSEAGELADLFRWLTLEESESAMQDPVLSEQIEQEVGDVFNNLLLLAMKLNIDLVTASEKKLELNKKKYPAAEWKGKTGNKKILMSQLPPQMTPPPPNSDGKKK